MTSDLERAMIDYYRTVGCEPPDAERQQSFFDHMPVLEATHDHGPFRAMHLTSPDGTSLVWVYRLPGSER